MSDCTSSCEQAIQTCNQDQIRGIERISPCGTCMLYCIIKCEESAIYHFNSQGSCESGCTQGNMQQLRCPNSCTYNCMYHCMWVNIERVSEQLRCSSCNTCMARCELYEIVRVRDQPRCVSCYYKCEAKCEFGGIVQAQASDPIIEVDELWKNLRDHTINAISSESNKIISGEFQEGKVRVESSISVLPPNTSVLIKIEDDSIVKAKGMSSLIIKLLSPVEVLLEVHGAEGKMKVIGGKLVTGEGDYKRGEGITIPRGSDATILFNEVVYSGKTSEAVLISMNRLGIRPLSIGITRITN